MKAPDVAEGPLTGIRVVAVEQAVAAPLCSRHLADLGAQVVKIERPAGGDFARGYDSVANGQSAYFVWLNRGKKSMALDLKSPRGREVFDRLLGQADVLLHNLGPTAMERLDYTWDSIHRRWPELIDCSITGYGRDGPYRDAKAFDLLLQAESGLASVTGTQDSPAKVGISIADISAGMYALAAILAALLERQNTGVGRRLEIAMLDCLAEWMTVPALYQIYTGEPPPRSGMHHATIAPYGPYSTADGEPILLAVQNDAQWARFCRSVLGRPTLAQDPRFSSNELRVRHRTDLDATIVDAFSEQPRDVIVKRLADADVPHASLNDVSGLVDHPQIVQRRRWTEASTPGGPVRTFVSPLDGDNPGLRSVPALGADTASILTSLGFPTGFRG